MTRGRDAPESSAGTREAEPGAAWVVELYVVVGTMVLGSVFVYGIVGFLLGVACRGCELEQFPFVIFTGAASAAVGYPLAYVAFSSIERSASRSQKIALAAVMGFGILGIAGSMTDLGILGILAFGAGGGVVAASLRALVLPRRTLPVPPAR